MKNRSSLMPPVDECKGAIHLLLLLAGLKLAIHLAVNLAGGYGLFRDEFYYIACSQRLAWGYVDQPPFSLAVLKLVLALLGDSLFVVRLLPAILGAMVVFMSGWLARELGGKKLSITAAALMTLWAPALLGTHGYYSMNSFDLLFWTLSIYLTIRLTRNDQPKQWILLGIILGLGLLNKISVLWLGAGLLVAWLATPHRHWLTSRGVWTAAAIAALLFLPHVIWQWLNGFPTLEFIKNATAQKYVPVSAIALLGQQALIMNPITLPLWLGGVLYFLLAPKVKTFRFLPILYATVFLILVINKNSKVEYLTPLFPLLFAMAAFSLEQFIQKYRWGWLKIPAAVLLTVTGIATAPFALPVLPVKTYIAYAQKMGMQPATSEKKELAQLPQFYADMFGWEKMTKIVAEAYASLTPEEKSACTIFCNNYGEAGAIDYYGRGYGLPNAISGHNNYWLWGPQGKTGRVVIHLGGSRKALLATYEQVSKSDVFQDEYCMPYVNNGTIFICKNRRRSLTEDWPALNHYQ